MSTNDHLVLNIKPNEDHDGGNDEKQKEADQKASKDMNLNFYIKINLVKHFEENKKNRKAMNLGKHLKESVK